MLKEVKYRTFDELLDSVRIDFRSYDLEGMIDAQSLIKIAAKINYELGIKINPSKSQMLYMHHGKARLPYDFDVLNFALMCDGKEAYELSIGNATYCDGIVDGMSLERRLGYGSVKEHVEYVTLALGTNEIIHGLHTEHIIVQAFSPDGTMLNFQVQIVSPDVINIISLSQQAIANVKVVIIGSTNPIFLDDAAAELQCDVNGIYNVTCRTKNKKYKWNHIVPLEIVKAKSVSDDCFNVNTRCKFKGYLKNEFFHFNYDSGEVFINYQSTMEDNEGNLLVMDHAKVNEYYEYALKRKILEDLIINGENLVNQLNLIEARYKPSRNDAISFIKTPDFAEMKKVWEINRKAQYQKYYNHFKPQYIDDGKFWKY